MTTTTLPAVILSVAKNPVFMEFNARNSGFFATLRMTDVRFLAFSQ